MRSLVQNLLTPKANPIGIDFGTDCLRAAQVRLENGQLNLVAVAAMDVPPEARADQDTRAEFFIYAIRKMLASGQFIGRRAMLALPAASMFIQHIRLPKMEEPELIKSLPWEMRGKLPIDPSHAVLRHMVAGEVFADQEPKSEVILMATRREVVEGLLISAQKARLDVIGMNVEMKAIVNCFSHIYRRKGDAETTNCFVDIGSSASRAVVSQGEQILFARSIPVGASQFDAAIAAELKMPVEHARARRRELANKPVEAPVGQFATVGASTDFGGAGPVATVDACEDRRHDLSETPAPESPSDIDLEQICSGLVTKLISELNLCRRYHEATFPNWPIQRLIFVGGEGSNRGLCQRIAREMALPAQIGDPLVRIGRGREVFFDCDLDGKQPQPGWAVAIGLSAGDRGGAL